MASFNLFAVQVLMLDKENRPKNFEELNPIDRDLTMFTITNLSLVEENKTNLVYMSFKLKRRVSNELLTTYLPTSLLLLISFVSIFFDRKLLGYVLAVNLTIILVITIIFTSKMEELPTTSDTKMIDLWMIFCLVVPILEVILTTSTECLTCSCHSCEAISTYRITFEVKCLALSSAFILSTAVHFRRDSPESKRSIPSRSSLRRQSWKCSRISEFVSSKA